MPRSSVPMTAWHLGILAVLAAKLSTKTNSRAGDTEESPSVQDPNHVRGSAVLRDKIFPLACESGTRIGAPTINHDKSPHIPTIDLIVAPVWRTDKNVPLDFHSNGPHSLYSRSKIAISFYVLFCWFPRHLRFSWFTLMKKIIYGPFVRIYTSLR